LSISALIDQNVRDTCSAARPDVYAARQSLLVTPMAARSLHTPGLIRGRLGSSILQLSHRMTTRPRRTTKKNSRRQNIAYAFHPKQIGAFVPAAPGKVIDPRPGVTAVIQTADVYVRSDGLAFTTDYNGGLDIVQFTAG
jgi:hypothetical protein